MSHTPSHLYPKGKTSLQLWYCDHNDHQERFGGDTDPINFLFGTKSISRMIICVKFQNKTLDKSCVLNALAVIFECSGLHLLTGPRVWMLTFPPGVLHAILASY